MPRRTVLACALLLVSAGCATRQMGINRMASALASATSVYNADNDPEFVRLAAPSTLKTVEMLLSQSPDHRQLLLTACSGFTEYAYAFLQVDAEASPDRSAAADLRLRAAHMYARARGYCLHGLALKHAGTTARTLAADSAQSLREMDEDDVPWLYWTAASWGGDISVDPQPLLRLSELAAVRAMLLRARAIDDGWDHGAIHEALIGLDSLPALLGGSRAAARADFDRAEQRSNGTSAFAYVALAQSVPDAAEKRRLLESALKVDVNATPSRRLVNLIAQRSARAMLRESGVRPGGIVPPTR